MAVSTIYSAVVFILTNGKNLEALPPITTRIRLARTRKQGVSETDVQPADPTLIRNLAVFDKHPIEQYFSAAAVLQHPRNHQLHSRRVRRLYTHRNYAIARRIQLTSPPRMHDLSSSCPLLPHQFVACYFLIHPNHHLVHRPGDIVYRRRHRKSVRMPS
ncbi:hypothetical protein AYI70_g8568 [Smittium culicis]|uniref:Uncharacterized protein n=1 Tax=Smittium culicis TaxID=133412 RepID=A0A1R1XFD4_9FUNG|nr:hypothetical protein AYI70_g8568 [Smittium culicis]